MTSEIHKIEIQTYSEILKNAGVVAFPTETVYGLGASAFSPAAIKKVFDIKGRPADNPLIVHISNYGMLLKFAAEIPPESRLLMQKFWPGPLTLVFEKKDQVLDIISGGLKSVAVRMPDHELALGLIDASGPLVAPSANKSGRPSPTRPEHIRADFGQEFPILEGGNCIIGLESTVLDVRTTPFTILRPGAITARIIKDRCGIDVQEQSVSAEAAPASPGMKYTHYAPVAKVRWMENDETPLTNNNALTLYLLHRETSSDFRELKNVISYEDDLENMARDLYDRFRQADIQGYQEIAIESFRTEEKNEFHKALKNRIEKAISR